MSNKWGGKGGGSSSSSIPGLSTLGAGAGAYRISVTNGSAASNGTDSGVNTRYTATYAKQLSRLILVYANYADGQATHVGELAGANPITVTAAIEYPSGTYTPIWFNGSRSVIIQPGTSVVSDDLDLVVPIPPNTNFWVRSFCSVTPPQTWQQGPSIDQSGTYPDAVTGSVGETDKTLAAIAGTSYNRPYGAFGLIGLDQPLNALKLFGLGDSIMNGQGDVSVPNRGWWNYATTGKCIAQRACFVGERASDIIINTAVQNRLSYLTIGCNAAIIAYGTNDFQVSTLAQLQANMIFICQAVNRRGMKSWIPTLLPRTISTDSWATTANQTLFSHEAIRVAFNDWLRGGSPVNPTTLVAVAVGTTGALLAGQAGHPISGYWEFANVVEVNAANAFTQDGGLWVVNGSASYATTDGTHPVDAFHKLIGAVVNLATMRSVVGVTG